MFVSPATLDMHLSLLGRHFQFIHLDDWLLRTATQRPLPRQACALTFDDGWRDNFDYAFPLLRRHSAPATIFLVSGMVGSKKQLWPKRLGRLLRSISPGETIPEDICKLIGLPVESRRDLEAWNAEAIDRAVTAAKKCEDRHILALLDRFSESHLDASEQSPFLGDAELTPMASSGLVRFGSHTRSHLRLNSGLAREVLHEEVVNSYDEIRKRIPSGAAPLFCYPNGEITQASVDLVRKHYIGAVTTQRGWHQSRADPYLIRRVPVHDDIASRVEGFLARLSGWR
jgi:peptidoglycan/xylan/chitin deacetylase (PgdA/CDA1 family)